MNVIKVSNSLNVVGICYGHQLIAMKHKAKVVKKNRYGGL
jgi:GMP synthase-like glutamine amidotransferase